MRLTVYRAFVLLALASLVVVHSAQCASNTMALPAEASFLTGLMKLNDDTQYEPWNQMRFPDDKDAKLQSGKRWFIRGTIATAADKYAAWDSVKAALLKNGWTLVLETRTQPVYGTMHFVQNGVEAWINAAIRDPSHVEIDVMEVAPLPYTVTLTAPQPTSEKVDPEKGNFP